MTKSSPQLNPIFEGRFPVAGPTEGEVGELEDVRGEAEYDS
ncbi:hypothetical protein ACFL3B_00015 [Gemmatimonadota bacterium]